MVAALAGSSKTVRQVEHVARCAKPTFGADLLPTLDEPGVGQSAERSCRRVLAHRHGGGNRTSGLDCDKVVAIVLREQGEVLEHEPGRRSDTSGNLMSARLDVDHGRCHRRAPSGSSTRSWTA